MLNFHGIPRRNSTAFVQDVTDGAHVEKRIVHVIPMTEVVVTKCANEKFPNLMPLRTQVVKVAFNDGSTRLGCVTLQDHEVGLSATVIAAL